MKKKLHHNQSFTALAVCQTRFFMLKKMMKFDILFDT